MRTNDYINETIARLTTLLDYIEINPDPNNKEIYYDMLSLRTELEELFPVEPIRIVKGK